MKQTTRAQRLNRRSEELSDRDLLNEWQAAEEFGDELKARIFHAEIEHRDCWL